MSDEAPINLRTVADDFGLVGTAPVEKDSHVVRALDAGFVFDPKDSACKHSRNEDRYTVWKIPYDSVGVAGQGLRPTIQIELTYASLRLPAVTLQVSPFVAEAHQRPPEMPALPCVSLTQTAAERLVAITRRTAMDLAGLSRDAGRPVATALKR